MQILKDEINKKILKTARIEFQEKGFEKASIRNIAKITGISKSNIYNYHNSKELLFEAVVKGTIQEIEIGFVKLKAMYKQSSPNAYTITSQKLMMEEFMKFVFTHSDDLRLLLFKSHGTKLSRYKENITEKLSVIFKLWMDSKVPEKDIPEFFILSVAGFYIDTIERIIANELTKEDVFEFSDYFLKFIYGGWKSIFQ